MGRPSAARVRGPLEPFAAGFLVELVEKGYGWTAVAARVRLMAELSAWLAARGLGPGELTPSLVEEFLGAVRASDPGKPWCSPMSERQLLAYLRGLGVIPPPSLPAGDPVDRLVVEFVGYLVRERGLTAGTSTVYEY